MYGNNVMKVSSFKEMEWMVANQGVLKNSFYGAL